MSKNLNVLFWRIQELFIHEGWKRAFSQHSIIVIAFTSIHNTLLYWTIGIREPFTSPPAIAFIYFSRRSESAAKLKLPVAHYQLRATIYIVNSDIITLQPKVPLHSTGI